LTFHPETAAWICWDLFLDRESGCDVWDLGHAQPPQAVFLETKLGPCISTGNSSVEIAPVFMPFQCEILDDFGERVI
jgi:hypothetical protein